MFFFVYGDEYYCVRVGFTGQRPLVYAAYSYAAEDELPYVPGQVYRNITKPQYERLHNHSYCNVSYIEDAFLDHSGNLECRTHHILYKFFDNGNLIFDPWYDRQV